MSLLVWCARCQRRPDAWERRPNPELRGVLWHASCHGETTRVLIAEEVMLNARSQPAGISFFEPNFDTAWRFLFEADLTISQALERLNLAGEQFGAGLFQQLGMSFREANVALQQFGRALRVFESAPPQDHESTMVYARVQAQQAARARALRDDIDNGFLRGAVEDGEAVQVRMGQSGLGMMVREVWSRHGGAPDGPDQSGIEPVVGRDEDEVVASTAARFDDHVSDEELRVGEAERRARLQASADDAINAIDDVLRGYKPPRAAKPLSSPSKKLPRYRPQ